MAAQPSRLKSSRERGERHNRRKGTDDKKSSSDKRGPTRRDAGPSAPHTSGATPVPTLAVTAPAATPTLHPNFWSGRLSINGQIEHSFFDVKVRRNVGASDQTVLWTTDVPPVPVQYADRLRVAVYLDTTLTLSPNRQQASQFEFSRSSSSGAVKSTVADQKELQKIIPQPPNSTFITVRNPGSEWTFLDIGDAELDTNQLYPSPSADGLGSSSPQTPRQPAAATSASSSSSSEGGQSPAAPGRSAAAAASSAPGGHTKSKSKGHTFFSKLSSKGKKKGHADDKSDSDKSAHEENKRPWLLVSFSWVVPSSAIRDCPPYS